MTVDYVELASRRKLANQIVENIELEEPTLLVGERGVGKTMLAMIAAAMLGRPIEVFHFSAVFDAEAAITGALVLRDGCTRFVRSNFLRAVTRPGTIILADEVNRAPGAALNALLSLLDFQARIVLDLEDEDQRVVERAPGVVFIATANIGAGYVGVEPMDAALLDRMSILRVGYPEDEADLLTPWGVSKSCAKEMVRLARVIREGHAHGNLPFTMSTRRLIVASKLVNRGVSIPEAFERNVAALDADALAALHATLKAAR